MFDDGEAIRIEADIVYIDGYPLYEPYIKDPPQYELNGLAIPEQQYFVLGDNRNHSRDSHAGWTVPEANIIGKAWISVWPPEMWGLVPDFAYANR